MKKIISTLFIIAISSAFLNCDRVLDPNKVINQQTSIVTNGSYEIIIDLGDGLVTDETGLSDAFTVVLREAPDPLGNVTIGPIVSSNSLEVSVAPATLTFTPANWAVPQTVTVTGVDDTILEYYQYQNVTINLGYATGSQYTGLSAGSVTVINQDDDGGPPSINIVNDGLVTSESGTTDTFTVVLSDAPTDDVTIGTISSSDTGEVTVAPASLVFTTANWSTPQPVTVTGVPDVLVDGTQTSIISLSNVTSLDSRYDGMSVGTLTAFNTDDDSPGAIVLLENPNGFITTEGGASTVIRMVLNQQPTANVTLGPISSNDPSEGIVNPATTSITFTPSDWNTIHSVLVTGQSDGGIGDGNIEYHIELGSTSSGDLNFNGLTPDFNGASNLDITVENRDYAGIQQYMWSSPAGAFSSISPLAAGPGIPISFNKCNVTDPATDEGYFVINFSFPFYFLSSVYTSIAVYTDGYASFNDLIYTDATSNNDNFFVYYGMEQFKYILSPWWDNLDTSTGGVSYYISNDPPGSRVLTIEWYRVATPGSDLLTFQIKLYESNGIIEFVYGPNVLNGGLSSASVGVKEWSTLFYGNTIHYIEGETGAYEIMPTSYIRSFAEFPAQNTVYRFTPPW